MRRLNTVADIVELYNAEHGRGAFVLLLDCPKQRVTDFKARDHLPAKYYFVVQDALKKIGYRANPRLFGMLMPQQKRAA